MLLITCLHPFHDKKSNIIFVAYVSFKSCVGVVRWR